MQSLSLFLSRSACLRGKMNYCLQACKGLEVSQCPRSSLRYQVNSSFVASIRTSSRSRPKEKGSSLQLEVESNFLGRRRARTARRLRPATDKVSFDSVPDDLEESYGDSVDEGWEWIPPVKRDIAKSQQILNSTESDVDTIMQPLRVIEGQRLTIDEIVHILRMNNGIDIRQFDLQNSTSAATYMAISSGKSSRHLQKLARSLVSEYKKRGIFVQKTFRRRKSLSLAEQWISLDFGDVLVNLFLPEMREELNLEEIYEKKKVSRG